MRGAGVQSSAPAPCTKDGQRKNSPSGSNAAVFARMRSWPTTVPPVTRRHGALSGWKHAAWRVTRNSIGHSPARIAAWQDGERWGVPALSHEHLGPHATLTDFAQFDHGCTEFPLTGKHAGLACAKCHAPPEYKLAAKSCVDCHAEPKVHFGKFGTNCRQCHSTETWKAPQLDQKKLVGFDHSKTKFPLTGAHTKVACVSCHKTSQFAGTATSCVSCHADPPVHRGKFGTDCKSCHNTQTWREATFANHRFPLHHGGGKQNKACSVCHQDTSDYRQYTCYGCHKHEPEKTAQKHRKLQLTATELAACTKCHPTGRESREKRPKLSNLLDDLEILSLMHSEAACPGLEHTILPGS